MTDIESYPQFYQLVADRFSCRSYSNRPVDRALISAIIDTARLAPSAMNRQPWTFVVADTPEFCKEVASCYGRDWVDGIPAFIIACGDHDTAWHRADGKDHTDVDLSIAIEHICLAATSLGLGSCWICNFDARRLRSVLNAPSHIEPIAIIPIGYPAPDNIIPQKKRKTSQEITLWGKF